MSYSFTISGFSDEIDSNVVKQFEHLNKLGISYFEPRGIDGKNIADLDDGEVLALKEKMDQYGIKVSSIGSPIGKISINDPMEPHMEKLARVIKTAKMLDTKYIRVFSFFIPEGEDPANYKEEVLSRMKQMVALAEKEGVVLLHENEKGIYGDIASRCKDIFEAVKSPALGCVFDPANFVQCGQTVYPDGFQLLKPYLTYMHIKDAKQDGTLLLPLFGYDGYRAQVDGQNVEVALNQAQNNRLEIHLSAGTRGTLRVRFAGKTWWRLTDAVSLLTLIGLFMERRKERKKHV